MTGSIPRLLFDLLAGLFGLLFCLAVAVQYNDPDPLRWIAVYGAAAIACGLRLLRRMPLWLPAATGLVAFGWALSLAGADARGPSFVSLFSQWEMKSVAVEEAREMWGLLVIAGWCAALTVAELLRRRRAGIPG